MVEIEVPANDHHVCEKVKSISKALADTDAVVVIGTVLDELTPHLVIDVGVELCAA